MTSALLLPLLSGQGPLALLVLTLVIFAETGLLVGFFLPGDSLLFTAGLFIASHVLPLPIALVIACTWIAGALGDQVAYLIGGRLGRGLFQPGRSRWISTRHVTAAREFFERHGHKAVILARFVPLARTFTPVVAGAVTMPRRRFTTYNVVGGLLWVTAMCLAGYFLGGVPFVAHHVDAVTLGIIALSLVPAGITLLRRHRTRAHAAPDTSILDQSTAHEPCRTAR